VVDMCAKSISKTLFVYRAFFVSYIVWTSARSYLIARAMPSAVQNHHHLVMWLTPLEIVAALAFLFIRIELFAAILLWFVFAAASLHELLAGSVPAHLFFYAGTVAMLVYASRLKSASNSCITLFAEYPCLDRRRKLSTSGSRT